MLIRTSALYILVAAVVATAPLQSGADARAPRHGPSHRTVVSRTRSHSRACRTRRPHRRCGRGKRPARLGTIRPHARSVAHASSVESLKEINYYPADGGWIYMWTKFDPTAIASDFSRMHALGANTVRIFIQPIVFGYPSVNATMAAHLAQVIGLAAQSSLRVHLTLFDLWSQFGDVNGSKRWASSLLAPYRGDPRIAVVELKNEVNPQNAEEMAWVRQMLPYLSTALPGTMRTVSVANIPPTLFQTFTKELAKTPPDFWDYHYYGPPSDAHTRLSWLKLIAGARSLFVGEFGYSTLGTEGNEAAGDEAQATYYQAIFSAAAELGLPAPAPWTLNDFAPGAIPPSPTASTLSQYDFGLYTVGGAPKPAVAVVRKAFAGG